PRVLCGQDRRLLAAQARDEMDDAGLDDPDLVLGRRRPEPVDPALEAEGAVVVEIDARRGMLVTRFAGEADRAVAEVELEPWRQRGGRPRSSRGAGRGRPMRTPC